MKVLYLFLSLMVLVIVGLWKVNWVLAIIAGLLVLIIGISINREGRK